MIQPDAATPKPPGVPRWVKVSAVVAGIVVLTVVVVLAVAGGDHGPGRHLGDGGGGSGSGASHTPPPGVDHGPGQP